MLVATGAVHLDLYLTGYRHIPTIGALFVVQVVAAFVLGAAVIAIPGRLLALIGVGFSASTLGGYILSLWVGLFGFNEVRTTAGVVAGTLEVTTILVLGSYSAWWALGLRDANATPARLVVAARRALPPVGVLAALALVLAVANSPTATTGAGTTRAVPRQST